MPEPALFHSEIIRALRSDPPSYGQSVSESFRRGITVHRNTVTKGLIDALADNFPTVERLVGREWFAGCAGEYVRAFPASHPVLALYGAEFPDFLTHFGPGAILPYLPDVARIDRHWIEAYFARDVAALAPDTLARFAAAEIFEQRLSLHPAARFGWFSHSAVTIWLHHRPPASSATELEVDGSAEGLLLTRPHDRVIATRLDAAGFRFLSDVRAATTLGMAAITALEMDAGLDIAGRLAELIGAGAFGALETATGDER